MTVMEVTRPNDRITLDAPVSADERLARLDAAKSEGMGDATQAMLERMTMTAIAAGGAIRRVLDYNLASDYAASLNARGVGPLRMIRDRCLNDTSYLAIVHHAGWGSIH